MKTRCTHIKADGLKCRAYAMKNSEFCWLHSPKVEDEVKVYLRFIGGKNSHFSAPVSLPEIMISDTRDIPPLLVDTIQHMRSGEIDVRLGTAIGYLSNILLKSYEVAGLESRIEKMEKFIKTNFKEEWNVNPNAWKPY